MPPEANTFRQLYDVAYWAGLGLAAIASIVFILVIVKWKVRYHLWHFLCRNREEGTLLPKRLLFCWAILFPGDFIFYQLGKRRGYDPASDCYIAHGVRFHSNFLFMISHQEGMCFKVTKKNGAICLEEIKDPKRLFGD